RAPRLVRLSLSKAPDQSQTLELHFGDDLELVGTVPEGWDQLPDESRELVEERAELSLRLPQEPISIRGPDGEALVAEFARETVKFPFRPVTGHWFGLDSSGRDVGVLILYATRTALTFGLVLVVLTYLGGIFLGAVQGYFGGRVDMFGQRLTEIWEAIPFLSVMILLGSVYGRSFTLLAVVYAMFGWIGISYYIRAEFLRLRKQPFVEAAKVMGIGRWKIMFRHILPNSLVPVITFFPFALVGAINALTALDFLGFGLPPGTPSWGNLLDQGQIDDYAWWLILFPAIALFLVSLLGIFIGEGLRAAFDPRTNSRLE
ncbi:MAG: ABC transporter permease subunit, partial [Verrucomicrobiota bacterium]